MSAMLALVVARARPVDRPFYMFRVPAESSDPSNLGYLHRNYLLKWNSLPVDGSIDLPVLNFVDTADFTEDNVQPIDEMGQLSSHSDVPSKRNIAIGRGDGFRPGK
uniref:Secreted protein n=1 Tax=Panagrellus redivivus TaxID=6233 RepID=A0A7E4ULY9_PANRE